MSKPYQALHLFDFFFLKIQLIHFESRTVIIKWMNFPNVWVDYWIFQESYLSAYLFLVVIFLIQSELLKNELPYFSWNFLSDPGRKFQKKNMASLIFQRSGIYCTPLFDLFWWLGLLIFFLNKEFSKKLLCYSIPHCFTK